MKFLKILLSIVVALTAIFFIGGMFLSKTYFVSRTLIIRASDTVIYNNVANFNNFLKWNPWSKLEPSAKVVISGPVAQPGHLYTWNGKETGEGQMLIKELKPASLVDMELKFLKPFESTADTKFVIEAANTNMSTVTWSMSGENKSTTEKWMGLYMDNMIGGDFESGLKNLKAISEKP